jgi:hypothetical protein
VEQLFAMRAAYGKLSKVSRALLAVSAKRPGSEMKSYPVFKLKVQRTIFELDSLDIINMLSSPGICQLPASRPFNRSMLRRILMKAILRSSSRVKARSGSGLSFR